MNSKASKIYDKLAIISYLTAMALLVIFVFSRINSAAKSNNKNSNNDLAISPLQTIIQVDDQRAIDSVLGYRSGDIREDPRLNPQIGESRVVQNNPGERDFAWEYSGQQFRVRLSFDPQVKADYAAMDFGRRNFGKYLERLPNDNVINSLARQINDLAKVNDYNDDQLAELAIAFVQSVPYDQIKANNALSNGNIRYNTPFEVLEKYRGICLDKTFLAKSLLDELGYGTAIFIYSRPNGFERDSAGHSALGLQCSPGFGLYEGDNYCYVETTSNVPIGIIPQMEVTAKLSVKDPNNTYDAKSLGPVEILNRSYGKAYQGMAKKRGSGIRA